MKDAKRRLGWALEMCRKIGLRLTPRRIKIIEFLATQRVPVSLETVMQVKEVREACDATTVYRTLMLFREVEVIRQVSLPDKTRFFVLNVPGESIHFLICRSCGSITELQPGIHCESMESAIAAKHGYTQLYHELQFFGLCPECQRKPSRIRCAKLPVRG